MTRALETQIPARSVRKLKQRFSHDAHSERVLAAAALWHPQHLDGEFILPHHFANPFWGWVFQTAMGARGEGLDVFAEWPKFVSKKSSWFYLDEEQDGSALLWDLYENYFTVTQFDVTAAAKSVRDLAVSRRT